jgi:amidase
MKRIKHMSWLDETIMARKGVAKGKVGETYVITEESQGKYHYVYGAYVDPILKVDPGAVVSAETHDAFEGAIKSETDVPSKVLNFPYLNPQNGPIYVNGAEKGDCLAVYIKSIVPRGPQPRGTTVIMPEFGGLVPTADTALLTAPLPERVRKIHVDAETGVQWNDRITLPYEPFIGTIGTAPEIEAISSLVPDYYGGNMDLPDVCPDTVIYLPVNTEGAYLYLGDCHAAQGDGELCGVALEHPTVTTVQIDLIKGWTIKTPRLENDRFYMTIGSARPMEDAARGAYRELIRWMVADFGFEELDAYMLLTQCGRVRLGNMVDPKYTVGASVLKSIIGIAA